MDCIEQWLGYCFEKMPTTFLTNCYLCLFWQPESTQHHGFLLQRCALIPDGSKMEKSNFFLGTESSWIEIKEDKHGIWEYDAIRKESYLLFILLFLSYFFFLFRETVDCRHLPWILGGCAGWRLSCTDMRCCWLWLPHFFLEDSDKWFP